MKELPHFSHEGNGYYSNALTWEASAIGHTHIVKELIDQSGKVGVGDESWKTALMYAVKGGHIEAVQSLLNSGADVNAMDEQKQTLLILAARFGYTEIVKLLLAYGADVYVKAGKTALMEAKENNHQEIVKIISDHVRTSIFWAPF